MKTGWTRTPSTDLLPQVVFTLHYYHLISWIAFSNIFNNNMGNNFAFVCVILSRHQGGTTGLSQKGMFTSWKRQRMLFLLWLKLRWAHTTFVNACWHFTRMAGRMDGRYSKPNTFKFISSGLRRSPTCGQLVEAATEGQWRLHITSGDTPLSPHSFGLKQPRVQFSFTGVIWFDAAVSHLQATMMVYQAVAEYSTRAKEMETKEYDLSVEVLLPHKIGPFKYYFGRQNSHVTRRAKVRTSRHYSTFWFCHTNKD